MIICFCKSFLRGKRNLHIGVTKAYSLHDLVKYQVIKVANQNNSMQRNVENSKTCN